MLFTLQCLRAVSLCEYLAFIILPYISISIALERRTLPLIGAIFKNWQKESGFSQNQTHFLILYFRSAFSLRWLISVFTSQSPIVLLGLKVPYCRKWDFRVFFDYTAGLSTTQILQKNQNTLFKKVLCFIVLSNEPPGLLWRCHVSVRLLRWYCRTGWAGACWLAC